jgi:hypothetical protein
MILEFHPTSNAFRPPFRHWLAPIVGRCAYCAIEVGRRYRMDLSRPAVICPRHRRFARRLVRRLPQ